MTIQNTFNLPILSEKATDAENLSRYIVGLTDTIETDLNKLGDGINGDIRSSIFPINQRWTPILIASGGGDFTYSKQVGWSFKQGLLVDIWFDVQWTATTGIGTLSIQLPYKVANTPTMPFVGVVQPSNIVFTVGTTMVINANTNALLADFYCTGNGVATTKQNIVASGEVIGHLRYIGQQNV